LFGAGETGVTAAILEALVQDIVAEMPNPEPAYNTVSTIVRILEQKGVVGHKSVRPLPPLSSPDRKRAVHAQLHETGDA
jgi:hypothetical protein